VLSKLRIFDRAAPFPCYVERVKTNLGVLCKQKITVACTRIVTNVLSVAIRVRQRFPYGILPNPALLSEAEGRIRDPVFGFEPVGQQMKFFERRRQATCYSVSSQQSDRLGYQFMFSHGTD